MQTPTPITIPVPPHTETIAIMGEEPQKCYVYVPEHLPPVQPGQGLWLEVRAQGAPMSSTVTGALWTPERSPRTLPVFHGCVQVGMTPSMFGFYDRALASGLRFIVWAESRGWYDEKTPNLWLMGWTFDQWKSFSRARGL